MCEWRFERWWCRGGSGDVGVVGSVRAWMGGGEGVRAGGRVAVGVGCCVVIVGAGLDCSLFILNAGGVVVSPLGVSTGGEVARPAVISRGSSLSCSNLGNVGCGGGEAGICLFGVVAPDSDEIHSPSLSSSSSDPLPSREASVKPALCFPLPTTPVADGCRERGAGWRGTTAKEVRFSRLATRAVLLVRPSVDWTRVAD